MELRCPSCGHSLYTLNKVYEVYPIGDLPTERFKYECPYCSAKLNREEVKKSVGSTTERARRVL